MFDVRRNSVTVQDTLIAMPYIPSKQHVWRRRGDAPVSHALAAGALLGAGGDALGAGPQLGRDLLAGPLRRGGLLPRPVDEGERGERLHRAPKIVGPPMVEKT